MWCGCSFLFGEQWFTGDNRWTNGCLQSQQKVLSDAVSAAHHFLFGSQIAPLPSLTTWNMSLTSFPENLTFNVIAFCNSTHQRLSYEFTKHLFTLLPKNMNTHAHTHMYIHIRIYGKKGLLANRQGKNR